MKPHRTYVSRWLVPALVLVAISQITAGLTDFQRDELSKVEAAESFYNSRNYEKAAESYQQGYFMTSKSRGLMFRYGMSLVRSDRPDAAESILNKVIHDNPIEPMWDRGRSYSETASIKAMAHFQLGVIYGNRQWWDLALGSFESADANDRSDWQPPFNIAVILLNHRNDPFQALDFLHDALNRSPDRADIKNLIANCHNTIGVQRDQAGDEAGALSAFSEALRWRPGWELAQKNIDAIGNRKTIARINAEVARSRAEHDARTAREANAGAERPPVPDLPTELVDKFIEALSSAFVPDEVAAMLKEEPRLALVRDSSERTTLHMARTREIAQLLLDAGADPKIKDNRGGNALFGAVLQETPDAVALLVDWGMNLLDRNRQHRTLLHEAVFMFAGPTHTIEWLLSRHPPLIAEADEQGVTPLMLAGDTYGPELVDLLLAHGADLSTADAEGKTAADHAAANGYPELESKLRKLAAISPVPRDHLFKSVETGDVETLKSIIGIAPGLACAKETYGRELIEAVAATGTDEMLDSLIKAGARFKAPDSSALNGAAGEGRTSAVRILLDAGCDPNEPDYGAGMTALQAAASGGHVETVRFLLERGANPNPEDKERSPLRDANAKCAAILVEAGADVNASTDGGTPLHFRVQAGDLDTAKFLISKGAKVDARDDQGRTPLHLANRECAELLVASGADVNANGAAGTPLLSRVSEGDIEAARFLIAHGAKVNERDADGVTALHRADDACTKLLLESGADVNALSKEGTPLHSRVRYGNVDGARLLIEKGAKVDARDAEGNTPIQFADEACVTLLMEHGAELNARNTASLTRLDSALERAKYFESDSWHGPLTKKFVEFLVAHGAKKGSEL